MLSTHWLVEPQPQQLLVVLPETDDSPVIEASDILRQATLIVI